jgi:hypothetical protein
MVRDEASGMYSGMCMTAGGGGGAPVTDVMEGRIISYSPGPWGPV